MNHCIKRVDSNNGSIYTFPKSIKHPLGITISSNGIIYVSTDNGIVSYWNDDNWKIITQMNKSINGLKIDSFNNLLFVESGSHCIKKMNLNNGEISLFAGSEEGKEGNLDGLLLESRFNYPWDIAMNNSSIYISDRWNHTIRKISLLGLWNKGRYFDSLSKSCSENHLRFPSHMRNRVVAMMVLSKRITSENNRLRTLPTDILFLVFQFVTKDATYFK